jgi:hypothetical protein
MAETKKPPIVIDEVDRQRKNNLQKVNNVWNKRICTNAI